jgi:phenylalanyl-tRNA synthetase beta chain
LARCTATKEDKYIETQRFSIFITGAKPPSNGTAKQKPVTFYNIKAIVDGILQRLKITDFVTEDATAASWPLACNTRAVSSWLNSAR